MELHYGDLIKKGKDGEFDVVIHGCNCFCKMGAGIAKHISREIPEAFEADKKTLVGDRKKLGTFTNATIEVKGHKLTVVNAYTQYYYGKGDNFDYENFPKLLRAIKEKYGDKRIGIPLIGCNLAGGDEPTILKMIEEEFKGLDYKLVEIDVNRKLNLSRSKSNPPEPSRNYRTRF